jgi:hypothetical protein
MYTKGAISVDKPTRQEIWTLTHSAHNGPDRPANASKVLLSHDLNHCIRPCFEFSPYIARGQHMAEDATRHRHVSVRANYPILMGAITYGKSRRRDCLMGVSEDQMDFMLGSLETAMEHRLNPPSKPSATFGNVIEGCTARLPWKEVECVYAPAPEALARCLSSVELKKVVVARGMAPSHSGHRQSMSFPLSTVPDGGVRHILTRLSVPVLPFGLGRSHQRVSSRLLFCLC